MYNGLDNIPIGSLDDLHRFRQKRYSRMYFCSKCARSFDADMLEKCRVCGSEVAEMGHGKPSGRAKPMFRFYCPKCEKTFMLGSKVDKCEICGYDKLHSYEWQRFGIRDRIRTRLAQLRKGAFSRRAQQAVRSTEKPRDKWMQLKMPALKRSKEEMPTN